MRSFLRSPAPILLAILTIPVDFIAIAAAAGSQPRAQLAFFQIASLVCLVVGFVVAFSGVRIGSAIRRMPLDERLVEIHLAVILGGIFLAIDGFALLMAIAAPAAGLFVCAVGAGWVALWWLPQLRKVTLSSTYVVERPPDVVFAFLSDSRNELRYQPDLESIEMVTAGPIGPGTQFRYRVHLKHSVAEGVEEIVDFELNRRLTSRVATALHPNIAELTFDPLEGGTRITNRFHFETSVGSALMGGWFRQPATNRLILERRRAGETRIKQILESAPL
jgi:hypothetical protein